MAALLGNLLGTVDGLLGTATGLLGDGASASGSASASAGAAADLSHTLDLGALIETSPVPAPMSASSMPAACSTASSNSNLSPDIFENARRGERIPTPRHGRLHCTSRSRSVISTRLR